MTSLRQIFITTVVVSCLLASSLFPVVNSFTTESREKDDDVTTVQQQLESSTEPQTETSSGSSEENVLAQAPAAGDATEDPCPGHATSPLSESTYFLYENGYWMTTDCPARARFNPVACCCYYALEMATTTPRPNQGLYVYAKCADFHADLFDIRRYRHFEFNRWVDKTCTAGFGFDRINCKCTIPIGGTGVIPPPSRTEYERTQCANYQVHRVYRQLYQERVNNMWMERSCPQGTTFDSIRCACDTPGTTSPLTTPNVCSKYRPYPGDNTRYEQLENNAWVVKPCPYQSTFDSRTCTCNIIDTTPRTPPATCPDTQEYAQDPHRFRQFENGRWVLRTCDGNRTYDPATCECSGGLCDNCVMRNGVGFAPHPDSCACYIQCVFAGDTLSASVIQCCAEGLYWDQDALTCDYKKNVVCSRAGITVLRPQRCKATLDLQFNKPGVEIKDSSENQFWVQNDNVTVSDGRAYFNGQARLTIPGLSNMDLGDTVYIKVRYQPTNTRSVQTIVANGDCDVRQSFGICTGSNGVDFYAETNGQRSSGKVSVPVTMQTRSMQQVTYALDEGILKGIAGRVTRTGQVTGPLQRRHSALVVGGGGECGRFQGYIDELQVFRCNPDN